MGIKFVTILSESKRRSNQTYFCELLYHREQALEWSINFFPLERTHSNGRCLCQWAEVVCLLDFVLGGPWDAPANHKYYCINLATFIKKMKTFSSNHEQRCKVAKKLCLFKKRWSRKSQNEIFCFQRKVKTRLTAAINKYT